MKKNSVIIIVSVVLPFILLLSGCGSENNEESTGKESPAEENRYINCEPGYLTVDSDECAAGIRHTFRDYDEYLLQTAKEENFVAGKWLSWEQFSMLGDFYSAGWWEKHPETCQYKYLYTDSESGKSWIYYIEFEKVPVDSGVTNIKEYKQWYWGKEILNKPQTLALPTLTANSFPNSNLLDIDPNDPAFDKCKDNKYGYRWYYVDDILDVIYNGELNSVCNLSFVYNGWKIDFAKMDMEFRFAGLDNTDSEILQKLVNADSYMEAIEELMDPKNSNFINSLSGSNSSYSSCYLKEDYLDAKEKSGFIAGENWLPWEQFSALGEFYSSFWWDGNPDIAQYEYLHTDPKTGETIVYRVIAQKLPDSADVTNIKEYALWRKEREYNKYGKMTTITRSDLVDISLINYASECDNGIFFEDHLYIEPSLCNIEFVYGDWRIIIATSRHIGGFDHPKYAKSELSYVYEFGTADPEIIQRLFEAYIYKGAIKELMDPANGGYAGG